jgi:hypothetical protein
MTAPASANIAGYLCALGADSLAWPGLVSPESYSTGQAKAGEPWTLESLR